MPVALAKDARGSGMQILAIKTTQTVTVSGTSAQSTAIAGSNAIRIISTTDCHITVSTNPTATTSDMFVSAKVPEYIEIENTTDKIAVIQNTSGGILYITEMT